jgi:lysyl-tRNA synthetase class I
MKIKAAQCNECGDVIFSRVKHDYRSCTCNCISVDGGYEYFKVSHPSGVIFKEIEIELDVSIDDLYDDWDQMHDKFGLIKTKDEEKYDCSRVY